jgi:uncharacterized protein YkwD
MPNTETARPGDVATCDASVAPRRPVRRSAVLVVLLGLVVAVAAGCDTQKANTDFAMVNEVRTSHGLAPLARSAELDAKARAHAARMASRGQLFHSKLSSGVPRGWKALGENVSYAHSIEGAQQALEESPPHLANMLNPAFNQIGVGVVVANGLTYVAQVFVSR